MRLTHWWAAGLAGTIVASPALAASVENASVRAETVAGKPGVIRLSVKDGARWRVMLESAGVPRPDIMAGIPRAPKVSVEKNALTVEGPAFAGDASSTLRTRVSLGPGKGQARVSHRLFLKGAVPVEALAGAWSFTPDGKPGKPDFTWTPNLRPGDDEVIGQHVFRSPAVVVQQGGLSAVMLPDMDVLDKNWRILPGTLSLDVRPAAGPRLEYTMQDYDVVRHVFYRHEPGKTKSIGPGVLISAYDFLLATDTPKNHAFRQAARWWWEKQGEKNITDTLPQAVPWGTYARTGIDEYLLPVAWRETEVNGKTVGAAAMDVLVPGGNATFFQAWFNDLRSAYGTYLFGKWMDRGDLVEKARQTRDLLLSSPQKDGLFPIVYHWDDHRWSGSPPGGVGGGPDIYHTVDCAWAAYWLLMWNRDLERSPESVAFAKRLGDFMLKEQLPSGEIPAYYHMDTMQPTDRLVHGAESTGAGMFLAFLGRETGEKKYLEGARKIAAYTRREIMPRNKWFDYETFYSCSWKPEGYYDPVTDQEPQNTLSIHWAAEMFRQLYLAGGNPQDLKDGEALMDYMNLYQQVWSPSFITMEGFGGYGVQNTDAEWNDARQAQFAATNLDYYALTGKREYFERGVAALRAGFATVYMPENRFISPRTYNKEPTGFADENYGHGGTDAPAGPTSWDWGTGSALASVAYARKNFGDVWVDMNRNQVFGINGVDARLEDGNLSLFTSVQSVGPVIVKGTGAKLPASIKVNGKARKVSPAEWKNGWLATPAPQFRLRHRPTSALTAENAVISVDVWPHADTADSTVAFQAWLGDKMVFQDRKPLKTAGGQGVSFKVPANVFQTGVQTMRYYVMPLEHNWDTEWPANQPFTTRVVRFGQGQPLWNDPLTSDLDAGWTLERPNGSVAEATGAGLQLTVPGDKPHDQWVGVNDAPKALRPVPAGPWSFSVHAQTDGLPAEGNYQAGIAVRVGPNDFAMFGPFGAQELRAERTGQNALGSTPFRVGIAHGVTLRARYDGSALWFDAKPDGGAWTDPIPVALPVEPTAAGVFLKTWQVPVAATVTFDSARMETLPKG